MKLTIKFFLLAGLASALLGACTRDFEELNTNPAQSTEPPANLLFTGALRSATLNYDLYQIGQNLHADMYVQYFANATPGFNTDRYETNPGWAQSFWNANYSNFGINIQEAINASRDNPLAVNKVALARIWKVWIMHRITDYWGDVPYSEAFRGVSDNITLPQYDTQESIYADMLKELKEAVASIDPAQPVRYGPADLIYRDNLDRWKKFGNSLRLRLAMRISKANPALAEQHVREVLAEGNLIARNDESAQMVTLTTGQFINRNPLAILFGFNEFRVSQKMVDLLQKGFRDPLNPLDTYADPRLPVYTDPNAAGERVGLPNGLNAVQLGQPEYARANFSNMGVAIRGEGVPIDIMLYDEVCFLRAEAIQKGWGTGSAEEWYKNGIAASLNRRGITNQAVIDTYLAKPQVVFNNTLEQIITQKWIALFPNGFEAWAEYRRTGFPTLLPNKNAGETNGQVPSRLKYPTAEQTLNKTNYDAAVSRQGADLMTTKVWWDRR